MSRKPEPNVAVDLDSLADRLDALGHVTRLRILAELCRAGPDGLAVGTLQDRLGIGAASTLSKHVAHLLTAGLMTQERRSTVLLCRISDGALANLCVDLDAVLGGGTSD